VYRKYFKRPLDIVLSIIAIVILFPAFLIIGLLVMIKLGSPIIYKTKRVGKDEKIFTMYKFRSMTNERDSNGNLLPDELRITKFGSILRSTSLDEIISILAEYSVVTDKKLYEEMYPVGLNPDGYVRMKGIQMDLDWYKDRDLLKGELNAEDVVDNSYVDFAVGYLGKYE
jgi:hypothetical protein